MTKVVTLTGTKCLRQSLAIALLTGRKLRFTQIRSNSDEPGLLPFEVTLLKFIQEITNGTFTEINSSGTEVKFYPGVVQGGKHEFDCGLDRCISYYAEFLFYIAPFAKNTWDVTFKGLTATANEISVDSLRAAALPVIKKFYLITDDIELKIHRRGLLPNGGGQVQCKLRTCTQLRPVSMRQMGKVKKIRGVAYACRVSPQLANRCIDGVKEKLAGVLSDCFITCDARKGPSAGLSPGFGISLIAETMEGSIYTSDAVSFPVGSEEKSIPEDLGRQAVETLFVEIYRGGSIDSAVQGLCFLMMALGPPDVSDVITGPLSDYSVHFLRNIEQFMSTRFKLEELSPAGKKVNVAEKADSVDDDSDSLALGAEKILATVVGAGNTNISRRAI